MRNIATRHYLKIKTVYKYNCIGWGYLYQYRVDGEFCRSSSNVHVQRSRLPTVAVCNSFVSSCRSRSIRRVRRRLTWFFIFAAAFRRRFRSLFARRFETVLPCPARSSSGEIGTGSFRFSIRFSVSGLSSVVSHSRILRITST